MDEPLCFVHFIIALTCFQNKKRPFCFSKCFQQTATGATLESRQASALTGRAYPPGLGTKIKWPLCGGKTQ